RDGRPTRAVVDHGAGSTGPGCVRALRRGARRDRARGSRGAPLLRARGLPPLRARRRLRLLPPPGLDLRRWALVRQPRRLVPQRRDRPSLDGSPTTDRLPPALVWHVPRTRVLARVLERQGPPRGVVLPRHGDG